MKKNIMLMVSAFRKVYIDSLFKNSIYLILTNALNLILGFFYWIIVAKYFSAHDVGITSAILSTITLISTISSIGLPTALIFYIPRDPKNVNNIINSSLVTNIVISFLFSMPIFVLNIWPESKSFNVLVLLVSMTILMSISNLLSGAFMAGRRSSFHMIKETIVGFIKIILTTFFIGFGIMGIFLSWGIGLILSVGTGFILLSKIWKYSLKFKFELPTNMAKFSLGNYLAETLFSFPRLIFPIMIVSFISTESAGYFFIAMTASSLLYAIPQSISKSMLAESSNGNLWNSVRKAIGFNFLLLIPGLIFFIFFGKLVLNIFNPNYAENAISSLIILVAASIPLSLIFIFNTVRNIQKRISSIIWVNLTITIITFILSIPLMKIIGIKGAATAYLLANTFVALVVIFRIKNAKELTLKLIKGDDKNIVTV